MRERSRCIYVYSCQPTETRRGELYPAPFSFGRLVLIGWWSLTAKALAQHLDTEMARAVGARFISCLALSKGEYLGWLAGAGAFAELGHVGGTRGRAEK
jgi:hypothetical protein